jgi:hypothetical protein
MFTGFFDKNFIKYRTNVPTEATIQSSSDLYVVDVDGDCCDLMKSIDAKTLPQVWKSQDQILTWLETHHNRLQPEGSATIFPFIVGRRLLIAIINLLCGELEARIITKEAPVIWLTENCDKLVLPQP